jgi:hypothetical protein
MIVWLASYPKSGNTWLRAIVSALIHTENGIFDFSLLKKVQQYPSRKFFKDFTTNFDNINDVSKYWILTQNKINLNKEIKFFKTHNLNCKINNNSFTNKFNTLATIYIVRDPRSLVLSISNHYSKTIEESEKFLNEPKIISGSQKKKDLENHIATLIGTWKENYNFWTKKNSNLLLIKYEDLLNNIDNEIEKIAGFLNKYVRFKLDEFKKKNIIETTKFENLRKMESAGLFAENAFDKNNNKKVMFFHKGPENNWRDLLDKDLQKKIESNFLSEMKELKYI